MLATSAIYSISAFVVHGLSYTVLVVLAGLNVGAKAHRMRAHANVMFGLSGFVAAAWMSHDVRTMFSNAGYRGSFAFPVMPLLLLIPLLAAFLAERSRARDGWLYRVAARTEWSWMVLVGVLPVVFGEASALSWLLLAPALMLPLALFDGARPVPVDVVVDAGPVEVRAARPAPLPEAVKLEKVTCAPGHCPVCAEAVTSRVATCARCEARQHVECFEFIGQCGIYGCGSQRITTAAATA